MISNSAIVLLTVHSNFNRNNRIRIISRSQKCGSKWEFFLRTKPCPIDWWSFSKWQFVIWFNLFIFFFIFGWRKWIELNEHMKLKFFFRFVDLLSDESERDSCENYKIMVKCMCENRKKKFAHIKFIFEQCEFNILFFTW